jgi:hypothetical protein
VKDDSYHRTLYSMEHNTTIFKLMKYSRVVTAFWDCPSLHPSPRGSVQHSNICGRVLVFFEAVLCCGTFLAFCSTSSNGVHCTVRLYVTDRRFLQESQTSIVKKIFKILPKIDILVLFSLINTRYGFSTILHTFLKHKLQQRY